MESSELILHLVFFLLTQVSLYLTIPQSSYWVFQFPNSAANTVHCNTEWQTYRSFCIRPTCQWLFYNRCSFFCRVVQWLCLLKNHFFKKMLIYMYAGLRSESRPRTVACAHMNPRHARVLACAARLRRLLLRLASLTHASLAHIVPRGFIFSIGALA
jgi:hypothetical protein